MGSFLIAILDVCYFGSISIFHISVLLGIKVQHALTNRTACSFRGQVSLDQLLFCIRVRGGLGLWSGCEIKALEKRAHPISKLTEGESMDMRALWSCFALMFSVQKRAWKAVLF